MQEGRNSIANALELRLSCTNPSILPWHIDPMLNNTKWAFHPLILLLIQIEWESYHAEIVTAPK